MESSSDFLPMPEKPNPKLRSLPPPPAGERGDPSVAYAELDVVSNFPSCAARRIRMNWSTGPPNWDMPPWPSPM
jgi:hypothetical protein